MNNKEYVECKDPIKDLKAMFVDIVQQGRIDKGQCPAKRPVFLKAHGIAKAKFIIKQDLPEELQVGIFNKPGEIYEAWLRFSSDTPQDEDFKTTVGIGIKLFNVEGKKLFGNEDDNTFDLILQNASVFFVDTATDMCEFTRAGVIDHNYQAYLDKNPKTAALLKSMAKPVPSVLASEYWSGLPFKFGKSQFVKYKLEPNLILPDLVEPPTDKSYLQTDLITRLKNSEARFKFMVQFQKDPQKMPLDHATVEWSESDSKPIYVADLIIPMQDITAPGQAEYGENLAMNIWRVTSEHQPVGSIAEARKVVYAASAEKRHQVNHVSQEEPKTPELPKLTLKNEIN